MKDIEISSSLAYSASALNRLTYVHKEWCNAFGQSGSFFYSRSSNGIKQKIVHIDLFMELRPWVKVIEREGRGEISRATASKTNIVLPFCGARRLSYYYNCISLAQAQGKENVVCI